MNAAEFCPVISIQAWQSQTDTSVSGQGTTCAYPLPSVTVGILLEHPKLRLLMGKGLAADTSKITALKTLELRDNRSVIRTAYEVLNLHDQEGKDSHTEHCEFLVALCRVEGISASSASEVTSWKGQDGVDTSTLFFCEEDCSQTDWDQHMLAVWLTPCPRDGRWQDEYSDGEFCCGLVMYTCVSRTLQDSETRSMPPYIRFYSGERMSVT